jgi:hypothetical protein
MSHSFNWGKKTTNKQTKKNEKCDVALLTGERKTNKQKRNTTGRYSLIAFAENIVSAFS